MSKRPEGDIWTERVTDPMSLNYGKTAIFDFTGIQKEDVKELMKSYVWHEYRSRNLEILALSSRLKQIVSVFYPYLVIKRIESLKDLTPQSMEEYQTYLATVLNKKGKPYSKSTQLFMYSAVKGMILYGQRHCRELLPEGDLFIDCVNVKYNRKVKIEYIPNGVMEQINSALSEEENIYLKAGITILKYTGMRISELCTLRVDCLEEHLINGYTMKWMDHKNSKERQPLPVRAECAVAVNSLLEHTRDIRIRTDDKELKNYLFLRDNGTTIHSVSRSVMGSWIRRFPEDHKILDDNGNIYHLSSHQFRRTLATDMLSNGVNINVIQSFLGHATPATTAKYYADVKDKQRVGIFKSIGVIGNIKSVDESIIANADELEWFRDNQQGAAKMCDGYCTKPVKNGEICDRLLRKHKCLSCSRFITTPEYLETHKNHLKSLEEQLKDNVFGEHYAAHLTQTIEVLREIIRRLEDIEDA